MTVRPDGRNAEHEVVDRQFRQDVFSHVADQLCVLPVGSPGLTPVETIGRCSRCGVPSEIRVVPRRLTADHHLAPRVGHDRCRRRQRERRDRSRVHARVACEISGVHAVHGVRGRVLSREVFLGFTKRDGREAVQREGGVIAAAAESIRAGHQSYVMRGHIERRDASDVSRQRS